MIKQSFPIVSIITPSYNQGHFIADTIESVISQKGEFYIDYIIMDGASTDNSVEIIQKYASIINSCSVISKTSGVEFRDFGSCKGISYRWVSEKDGGQSAAINAGVSKSIGDWVTWLCSDDVVLPTWLNSFSQSLRENQFDIFFGDVIFLLNNKAIPATGTETYKSGIFAKKRMIIQQPGTIIRREKWLEIGGLDQSLNWTMDYDLFLRMEVFNYVFYRKKEFIAIARIYPEAKTSSGSFKRFLEYVKILSNSHRMDFNNFSLSSYILYFIEFIIKKMEQYPKNFNDRLLGYLHKLFWKIASPKETVDIQARFLKVEPNLYKKYVF